MHLDSVSTNYDTRTVKYKYSKMFDSLLRSCLFHIYGRPVSSEHVCLSLFPSVCIKWYCISVIFSWTLQLHCEFRYSPKMLSVVGCMSVTRVYCDKTGEARIMRFSLKCSPMHYLFACQVWLRNSKDAPWSGAQTWVGRFLFAMLYIGNGAR